MAEVASSNFNDLYPLSVLPFSVEPNPHFWAQKRALWRIGTPSTAWADSVHSPHEVAPQCKNNTKAPWLYSANNTLLYSLHRSESERNFAHSYIIALIFHFSLLSFSCIFGFAERLRVGERSSGMDTLVRKNANIFAFFTHLIVSLQHESNR